MGQNKKQKQEWKPFFHLLKEAKLPWGWYVFNIAASLVCSTVMVKMPQVAGKIMAGEIFDSGLVALYIAVTIGGAFASLPISVLDSWISLRADRNLRKIVWKRIIHLPMKEVDAMPPTSLVSRVTSDTSTISYTLSYIFSMFNNVYSLVLMLITIAGMNMKIFLMMGLLIPCIMLANIPSHFMYHARDEQQNAAASYTNFLAERLSALRQIKVCASEEKEDIRNDEAAKACFRARIRLAKLDFISQPLIYGMDAVVQAVVLIYGGYLLNAGEINSEVMVSLFMYAVMLPTYCYQFVFCWQNIKQSQGAARTAGKLVQTETEEMRRKQSFAIPDADLRLEDVCFAYEGKEQVLDHVSMEIPRGKVTAIAGPSGSGKTTVLKLLERLYQPDSGRIMFGGREAEDIHLDEWRASFGMVPQNSPLLFGTVRDNITYGIEGNVSEKEMDRALEAANVREIIERMQDGMESDIGDVGSRLSGGERQRIALARMILKDPEYLLLDEATSSLDAHNESRIMKALGILMRGRTSVVVAHNLRTIKHADHIIFMEKGRVVGTGTHDSLYRNNEKYRRYVDLQRV